jgi:hypothetical protein
VATFSTEKQGEIGNRNKKGREIEKKEGVKGKNKHLCFVCPPAFIIITF